MNGGVLSKLLTNGYRSANKDLKSAIDFRLYDESPDLFHTEATGNMLGEGGSATIPRLHVEDLKRYFGRTEDIPSRYKRATGKQDIDELAALAGHDDIDSFVESIQGELSSRSMARENKKLLSERRNDPEFIKETQRIIDEERAMYSAPEVFEPSARDYQWYVNNVAKPKSVVHQIDVKAPQQTGMKNFKINRNDISYAVPESVIKYIPSNHNIPVRGPAAPTPPQVAPPAAPQNVVPLNSNRPIPTQDPGWRGGLANILTLQTATGAQ